MKTTNQLALTFVILSLLGSRASAATIIQEPVDISVSLGVSMTNQVTATGVNLRYQWRHDGLELTGATNRVLIIVNVQTTHGGTYSVLVTDASGSVLSRFANLEVDPAFTKIMTGPVVSDRQPSWSVSWGDYNGDGFIDLVVGNTGVNSLYRNNGDSTFSRFNSGPFATDASQGACFWGDYDNDGNLDLFAGNFDTGLNTLYHNTGEASLTRSTNDVGRSGYGTTAGIWADYDKDGYLDLFVPHFQSVNRLYRNNRNGTFTSQSVSNAGPVVSYNGASTSGAFRDLDEDGFLDLIVTSSAGSESQFYRNQGNGKFANFDRTEIGDLDDGVGNWNGQSWGDYDNDGDLDLVLTDGAAVNLFNEAYYRNEGKGRFKKLTVAEAGPIVADGKTGYGSGAADYDNDGWLDICIAVPSRTLSGETGDKNLLYHNNGDGTFARVFSGSIANDVAASSGCAWGDYNNDGFMDLAVANGGFAGPQNNFLYRNQGNSNHWLKLNLIGAISPRSAVGANVRLKATIRGKTFWQRRAVHESDGEYSQHDPRPNFGLGDATVAEVLRIEWPSGIVQEMRDVAANQMLVIQESVADIFPAQADVSLGATLTLSLTNVPPDSTLQWQHNGVDVAGATNATLEFSNATTNLNGRYTIVLSNATGLIFPRPAVVRVFDRPIITSQSQSTNVLAGTNVTLSVTALSPLPITYQWQFNGTNLVNDGSVSGSTTTNLSLTNVQLVHDGLYTVVASDAIGSVTSQPAALRILIKPVIVQAPLSQSVVASGSVTFSIEISGNPAPLTYQWRQGSATLTNMVLPEKKAFFTLNNVQTNQGGLYRVLLANAASPTLSGSSPNVSWNLTVLPDADGDGLPDAWEIAYGLSSTDLADALFDSDGDGQSNLAEYRSGTSPTNATNCLKLEAVTQANGQVTVSFNAVSNQTYTVEWCAQLNEGAWSRLADVVARASDRLENVTHPSAGDASRFYRVVTPRRP